MNQNLPKPELLQRLSQPIPMCGCWIFDGTVLESGYGQLSSQGKIWRAHRLAWTIHHGPIPAGLIVCHRCDIASCVNPEHLFLGTWKDNAQDRTRKGRNGNTGRPRSAYCRSGKHLLEGANVFINKNGSRFCTICNREYLARKKSHATQQARS